MGLDHSRSLLPNTTILPQILTLCPLSVSVNLGPVAPTLAEADVVATGPGSAYNPRCIKRDISAWVSSQWNTDANSTTLITQNPDIYWFQTVMQGDFASGFYGVHTGGHFTFGGDPGGDIFSSPGDPAYVESSMYPQTNEC